MADAVLDKAGSSTVMKGYTIDLRYVAVEYELWGLGQVLPVLEATIDRLAREDEAATIASLREAGATIDDGDVDIAYQDIAEKRDYVLPRFVRGPFVIALWATFESLIQAIARERAKAMNAPLGMSQLRGDFIAKPEARVEVLGDSPIAARERSEPAQPTPGPLPGQERFGACERQQGGNVGRRLEPARHDPPARRSLGGRLSRPRRS